MNKLLFQKIFGIVIIFQTLTRSDNMSKMDLKYSPLRLRDLGVLLILFKYTQGLSETTTTDFSTNSPNENYCVYDEEEVQGNPWAATLQIRNGTIHIYFPVAILNAYTVLAYRRSPFKWIDDRLGFLPWGNYTVLIGASRRGNDVSFLQSLEVLSVQPHPDIVTKPDWWFAENDYVVIQLRDPIELTRTVRPVCLPDLSAFNSSNIADELNILYGENNTAVVGGWKNVKEFHKTSLTVRLRGMKECEEEWRLRTQNAPYQDRACGYVSQQNTNNPDADCISKDSGVLVSHSGGRGHYTFMGFVNNFYSFQTPDKKRVCNEKAIFFIFKLTPRTITWLNAAMTCDSSQYTCHNGECAPLRSVCNQLSDGCSDHSDEDPIYCRALKPCLRDHFACGVYGPCIPRITDGKEAQNCDGVPDCPQNEDEENCPESKSPVPSVWIGISVGIIMVIAAPIFLWRRIKRRSLLVKTQMHMCPKLTENDIVEFEEGCEVEGASSVDKAANTPYNALREEYEIESEDIEIGEIIGGGYFSDVYKGCVRSRNHTTLEECAIKIPKPNADAEQIKGFLKEIKIMAYVGKHKNIANFIGAHTSKLREGILHIIVELCDYGSMEDFLKNNRQSFNNLLNESGDEQVISSGHQEEYISYVDVPMLNTSDLIRWSSEVAAGMAHLANKQVVHGDLAARNILLDKNRTAKICDFGLSKHLYTNIHYVTSSKSRVPWKWMAVEALLERTLSTKSDVWSFGVALWEIFTLGNEPYGDQQWSPAFPFSLSSTGCPLQQPEFANIEIIGSILDMFYAYLKGQIWPGVFSSRLRQKCWAIDPTERPSFEDIETDLLDCLEMLKHPDSIIEFSCHF